MKKLNTLIILLLLISATSHAQKWHVGVFTGAAAYNGDLTDEMFPKKVTNGALGITLNYEYSDKIFLRGGFTYAIVGGADRFSKKPDLVLRNLSFETRVFELSAIGEYYLFNLYERRLSPYGFAGLAVYKYDPYAYDEQKNKVFLQPLSTEGQGLPGYALKPYKLTQFAIPFGGGVKYAINDNIRVGLELGIRKIFTDYFDDVSGVYAGRQDLQAAKGSLAVSMSYRGDEVTGGNLFYPLKDTPRGGAESKDMYYFGGLHITYRLGGGPKVKKSGVGCPSNIY
jgi:opacity protein-like surface antigen